MSHLLDDLLAGAPAVRVRRRSGPQHAMVEGVTLDSRQVAPGFLFACLRGAAVDGHDFAPAAVDAGASVLLVERELDLPVTQVVVDDSRAALGPLAAAFHGHPSEQLLLIGVTGTNGKTTTTHLLASILRAAGHRTEVIGTLSGRHTTPEAPDLHATLARFVHDGVTAVAMEVSSHALALHRVDGARFAVAVFTNLGRDHLDFHHTPERYFAAKARLFEPSQTAAAVVNVDDPHGRLLLDAAQVPTTPFSLTADVEGLRITPAQCAFHWRGHDVTVPLGGRFNAENALGAATAAVVAGVDESVVVAGLAAAPPVPGRFEAVDEGQPFTVLVDYAHTPDGIREALDAAREAAAGHRVLVVFGCGGERDAQKRPDMGAAAAAGADVVVVTSDNPRREDPAAIMEQVLAGVPAGARTRVHPEIDRRAAIRLAVRAARPGDVLVIAGKGHETTQTVGEEVRPFDDRVVAAEALREAVRG
jgi:UDP-N-acetylmuramoyl-L-alanyl-D-glutamate--2,6-diaminopimelate ligase